MATVLEKVPKLTYVENLVMALYQVFTSVKNSIISENLVLLTQNEQFRARSARICPTISEAVLRSLHPLFTNGMPVFVEIILYSCESG